LAKSPLNWLYNFVKLKKRVFFPIYPLAYCFRARLFLYLKKNNFFILN